ncbi:unnamed protein product [Amoebophrya sp. A120]|nr:unnamed protein product [Amoebophrya sp. A120]|eukprot:GSA120T00023373001.1
MPLASTSVQLSTPLSPSSPTSTSSPSTAPRTSALNVDELLKRASAVRRSSQGIADNLRDALETAKPEVEKVRKRVDYMTQLQEQIERSEQALNNDPDGDFQNFVKKKQIDWVENFVTWETLQKRVMESPSVLLAGDKMVPRTSAGEMHKQSRNSLFSVVQKTNDEWKRMLSAEAFYVMREEGTEKADLEKDWDQYFGIAKSVTPGDTNPGVVTSSQGKNKYSEAPPPPTQFSGADATSHVAPPMVVLGYFRCTACGLPLYRSDSRFRSNHHGWPAFNRCLFSRGKYGYHVALRLDFPKKRCEILCRRCEGHLGHAFFNETRPGSQRHCVNAVCLQYVPGNWDEVAEFVAEGRRLENREYFEVS